MKNIHVFRLCGNQNISDPVGNQLWCRRIDLWVEHLVGETTGFPNYCSDPY